MRKISYRPYIFLVLLSLFFLSFSQASCEKVRSVSIGALGAPWRFLSFCGSTFSSWVDRFSKQASVEGLKKEIVSLKQENYLLQSQLETLKHSLSSHTTLLQEIDKLKGLSKQNPLYEKREREILRRVDLHLKALPARVIFREPSSWSSSLWINVGHADNQLLDNQVVAKNSPVLVGMVLVGVVEYVAEHRSRVRLITDPGLTPSVRVLRQDMERRGEMYLAKGELQGSGKSLFRARGHHLRGVGFNYDFADSEGPARVLRGVEEAKSPLIKAGDLLVTTGMDGIFPAGLKVAFVTEVAPLNESACSYEIEARTILPNLENLSFVTILPPLEGAF